MFRIRTKSIILPLVACAAFLVPLSHASATILFAGGEDSDFICTGMCGLTGNATYFDSGYAREALWFQGAFVVPPHNYYSTPAFTPVSSLWLHFSYYFPSGTATWSNGAQPIRIVSPDGVPRILLRLDGTAGSFRISKEDAAGTVTDLVTTPGGPCPSSRLANLDLYIDYSISGEVALYCDGVEAVDYTGDVTTDGATQLDQVQFSDSTSNNFIGTAYSEVIVATTNTTQMRLARLTPTAAGATDAWDVGSVSNVNETTLDDTTVNAASTTDQLQLYTLSALPSNNLSVLDLWMNMRASADTAGPQHIEAAVRTGGTNYFSALLAPLQNLWSVVSANWPANPNTGAAWTVNDLGAGFNLGFFSQN